MKKNDKLKDIISIIIYIITFLVIYIFLTKDNNLFASNTDFRIQHYLIPEYFRTLFYSTHNLLPNLALNLGSGQNIYNFSYYGLLNPIIMISYLFPKIKMIDYIIISTSLLILSSVILFYFFLKKKNYNYKTRFIVAFLFLCATPLTFHIHRHIMFINYFPFLILGLFGIDKYLEKKDSSLLIISVVLIILSSYYFSISAIMVLIIYYTYRYIGLKRKNYIKDTIKLSIPFIISIMITAILLLPTAYSLLNGRSSTTKTISILSLLKPTNNILYDKYSMGLTLISVISIIYWLFKNNNENKFLARICILISVFPIFNYILNGTLYLNAKSLIPFIPLVLILTADFLNIIFKKEKNIKQTMLLTYLIISSFIVCLYTNTTDTLMKKEDIESSDYKNTEYLINYITNKDKSFYRINNQVYTKDMINKVNNIKEYKTTMYSSSYNKLYKDFYYNTLENNVEYRNSFMISSSSNILSQIFLGEKYIITKDNLDYLKLVNEKEGIKIYENDNVLPLGYANNHKLNIDEFNKLDYPTNVISLLSNIVISDDNNNQSINIINENNIDYETISSENININNDNNIYEITADKLAKMKIKLNNITKNKLVLLQFTNKNNPEYDLRITINNQTNTLTNKSWKYHNNNYTFHYFLYNTDTLDINFEKGKYKLSDFKIYILDIPNISNIDKFEVDTNKTKGDIIEGDINVTNNSYFNLQIPYDKGYKIYVDDIETKYEKSNLSFIGFNISKGNHHIKIIYTSPYKNISIIISILGILLFIINKIIYINISNNTNNKNGDKNEIPKKNRHKRNK